MNSLAYISYYYVPISDISMGRYKLFVFVFIYLINLLINSNMYLDQLISNFDLEAMVFVNMSKMHLKRHATTSETYMRHEGDVTGTLPLSN